MKGSRLPVRLPPRRPRWLSVGGPVLVTAAWAGLGVAFCFTTDMNPARLAIGGTLFGVMGLLCVFGLSRVLATSGLAGETFVEVDRHPAAAGDVLRCFVSQRASPSRLRTVEARLLCLHRKNGRDEETVVDLPLGSSEPEGSLGVLARFEAESRIPADGLPTRYDLVRWCIRVRTSFDGAADLVEDHPLVVVRPS